MRRVSLGFESRTEIVVNLLFVMAAAFILVIGLGTIVLIAVFILDVSQTKHAVRRNYPVIGHLRYFFEYLGIFFRQYFFAMEREELPFNREQRNWVYRAAKNIDNTVPFGSTRDLRPAGTVLFANTAFPMLEEDLLPVRPLTIGPDCAKPYTTASFFNISAMSFGAISKPAVQALSNGARLAGCWLNTGEGGLTPWHLEGGADIVFQIGTAKYGVCEKVGLLDDASLAAVAAHEQVRMFEIKLSQGAKPGKGGLLPGAKITPEIAAIRGIPAGRDSISPNRHLEVADVGQLLDFIGRVRSVTGKPTGIKTAVGDTAWIDDLCAEINRRGAAAAPDFITVDSADGGSGAAPASLMDFVGLTIQESLPLIVDKLLEYGLRDRVKVIASGKLINPGQVAWALCAGADFTVSARGFMFALGCIHSLQCDRNTCPTGITTHKTRLQAGLDPQHKAIRVKNYAVNLAHGVGMIAHSCGLSEPRQLRRQHCRIVQPGGRSVTLDQLYPMSRDAKTAPGASKPA